MKRLSLVALLLLTSCQDHRTPTQQAAEWWPPSERQNISCVIRGESGGNESVVGLEGEVGVLQIHPTHRPAFREMTGKSLAESAYDSPLIGQFGYSLWLERGYRPWWNTARKCGLL